MIWPYNKSLKCMLQLNYKLFEGNKYSEPSKRKTVTKEEAQNKRFTTVNSKVYEACHANQRDKLYASILNRTRKCTYWAVQIVKKIWWTAEKRPSSLLDPALAQFARDGRQRCVDRCGKREPAKRQNERNKKARQQISEKKDRVFSMLCLLYIYIYIKNPAWSLLWMKFFVCVYDCSAK